MKRYLAAALLFIMILPAAGCAGGNLPDGVSTADSSALPVPATSAPESHAYTTEEPDTDTVPVTVTETETGTGADTTAETVWEPTYGGEFGTAGRLEGDTLIISIFTSDAGTSWSGSGADADTAAETLRYLGIASAWITASAKEYGSDVNFIFDWQTDGDLRYDVKFDEDLVLPECDMYTLQSDYVKNNIDTEGLRRKYHAENVIYFFFFNTEYGLEFNPWAVGGTWGDVFYVEYVNLYVRFGEFFAPPATYAHEILHAFGAPDMYYENNVITREYVTMCEEYGALDIMFTVNMGDEITSRFTPLDAYYVGIADRPAEADAWGLGYSGYYIREHDDGEPKG